jgi:hypothetical protein
MPSHVVIAALDGADSVAPYPYAGFWWRKRIWWTLPRALPRALYLKRDLTAGTGWYRAFLTLPPRLVCRLPEIQRIHEINVAIPQEKVVTHEYVVKNQEIASHIVDPEVAARLDTSTSRAFDDDRRVMRTCADDVSRPRPSAEVGNRRATTSRPLRTVSTQRVELRCLSRGG